MIYLKENEEKNPEQFRFSQTFYQCFHSIFFPRCIYIHGTKEPACCGNP